MTKGRKPLPGKLKKSRGTDQPVRMNYDEPTYEKITKVSVPRILKSSRAKKIYRERSRVLINMGIIAEPDVDMLVAYANTLDLYYQAVEEQNKSENALTVKVTDSKGNNKIMMSPYIKLQKELIEVANKLGSQFGFTPSSRASLKVAPEKEQDPLEKFLNR